MSLMTIKVRKLIEDAERIVLGYKPYDTEGIIIIDKKEQTIWIEKLCREDESRDALYANKAKMNIASKYFNGGIEEEFMIY